MKSRLRINSHHFSSPRLFIITHNNEEEDNPSNESFIQTEKWWELRKISSKEKKRGRYLKTLSFDSSRLRINCL